jgi:hypothetical protein
MPYPQTMTTPRPDPPTSAASGLPRLSRSAFRDALAEQWEPGDHMSLVGPTHRGKSVLFASILPAMRQFPTVAILCCKGRDPAYQKLGRSSKVWPPKQGRAEAFADLLGFPSQADDEKPRIWRVDQLPLRTGADWAKMRAVHGRVLSEATARPEGGGKRGPLMIVVDDSRITCDARRLGLEAQVVSGLIIGRSKRVSMVNMFQAPRWVPREGLDQITHGLVWNNADHDTAKRLAEISGYERTDFLAWLRGLSYYECLWFDVRAKTIAVVSAK